MIPPLLASPEQAGHHLVIVRDEDLWSQVHGLDRILRQHLDIMPGHVAFPHKCCRIEVMLTNDTSIEDLNRRFRNKHGPTDVLSFPDGSLRGQTLLMGEIALSWQQVRLQAADITKTMPVSDHHSGSEVTYLTARAAHLFVHGVLHLLGYDHQNNDDAEKMEALEAQILFHPHPIAAT